MAVIREDEFGLYVSSGGYAARPVSSTRFAKGDTVKAHHHGGSPLHGVGKDDTCGKGEYLETWLSTGMSNEQTKDQVEWYMNYGKSTYPLMF
jgi:hypothetical protein